MIDFGVAKAIDQRLTERTLFTQFGALVGTPEYMSPEQAGDSGAGIDTRSDVYALGVLLYELLTGTTPLGRVRLLEAAFSEVLRRIREEEPPQPSTRLSGSGEALASIAACRDVEPARLARLVRGELDWITMKALRKTDGGGMRRPWSWARTFNGTWTASLSRRPRHRSVSRRQAARKHRGALADRPGSRPVAGGNGGREFVAGKPRSRRRAAVCDAGQASMDLERSHGRRVERGIRPRRQVARHAARGNRDATAGELRGYRLGCLNRYRHSGPTSPTGSAGSHSLRTVSPWRLPNTTVRSVFATRRPVRS